MNAWKARNWDFPEVAKNRGGSVDRILNGHYIHIVNGDDYPWKKYIAWLCYALYSTTDIK